MFRTKEKDLQRNESSSQRSNPDVLTNNYNGFKWRNDLCCPVFLVKICLMKELERMTRPLYGKHNKNMMKTDVRETENSYELDIDLPGFKKDEISIQLDNGYLSIQAAKGLDKDEEKKDGQYIRRERYAGSMSRTFYVGDTLTQNDIRAKFEDGILKLTVPKKEPAKIEQNKYIAIE